MARRKARKKVSKKSSKKSSKKTSKKVSKRAKKAIRKISATVAVPKSALAHELSLLTTIEKRVRRIDHATSPGRIQRIREKRRGRKADLESAWEEGRSSGVTEE
jgi:ribonuclease D